MLVCGDRARRRLRRLMWWFAGVLLRRLAPTQVPPLRSASQSRKVFNQRKLAACKTLALNLL